MEEKSSLTEYKPTWKRQAVRRDEQDGKLKTAILIADLLLKAVVAATALIEAIK